MAVLTYQMVKDHADAHMAMTGLNAKEFRALLLLFGSTWTKMYVADEFGRGRPPAIKSMEDRLFFILYYYKCYPLQEVIGFLFGISQERVSETVQKFTEVLLKAFEDSGFAPEKVPEDLKKSLNKIRNRLTLQMEPSAPSSGRKARRDNENSTVERRSGTP